MKICIVGAGAIGGWIGAWMARAGNEVSLVARGEHLRVLRDSGLTFQSGGQDTRFKVAASSEPADFGSQDVVFIGLKAYSIGSMLPRLAPLVGPDTVVVPAINGLPWWYFHGAGGPMDGESIACLDPERRMFADLDPSRIVGCVVHGAAQVIAPGTIRHTAGNLFILGEPDGSESPRVLRLSSTMREAGFDAPVTREIRQEVWMKLIGNLSYNPIAALTLAWMNEINANERLLAVIRQMMVESMRVAEALGIRISMSIERRIAIARDIGRSKISMHQDVDKGRPLETDAIVGAVVELARRLGVDTPVIDVVHALIEERARHLAPRAA